MSALYNIEAEAVILATLLHDPEGASEAYSMVPEDFVQDSHREMFSAMMAEISAGQSPAVAVIAQRLKDYNGQGGYIFQISGKSSREDLPSCIAEVRRFAALRRLSQTAQHVLQAVEDPGVDVAGLASAASQEINRAMSDSGARFSPVLAEQAAETFLAELERGDASDIIPSGLKSLDRRIGGFPRQELTLVAGRPSMGKSAFLVSLARKIALRGYPVIFFSLEMPKTAIAARMIAELVYSGINHPDNIHYSAMIQRRTSSNQRPKLVEASGLLKGLPLLIDDQPGLTMVEIQGRALRFAAELEKQGKRLGAVIIDHLGKVKASDRYAGNMVHETGEKSDAMMTMAKLLDVALITAQQLNRGSEGREDKRPLISDLRDSGNLEQDAHTVLLLYRAAYYLERQKCDDPVEEAARIADLVAVQHQLEVIIAKSRNGEIGNQKVFADLPSNAISDLASEIGA